MKHSGVDVSKNDGVPPIIRKGSTVKPIYFLAAALAFGLCAGAASAAPIVYTGADPGAGPGDPFPNASAAAASFASAASGTRTLIDFESAPVGPSPT